ncbi:MAG: type II 3-dehydroquinate dehydratase [bacterium]|nr:type II 3-dehydroquinate dehydratase [bacterium]
MRIIWVIQGPNLNLLGEREPELYGSLTLPQLQNELDQFAATLGVELRHFQSNHEGALIDKLQDVRSDTAGALLNAGGYTHSSIALGDTVRAVKYPVVEVHITDTNRRESFRRNSYLSNAALATFQGEGVLSYRKALQHLIDFLDGKVEQTSQVTQSSLLFSVSETIRLDDTDAAGILFNAHLFRICHRVYEKWMATIGFSLGSILAERKWGLPIGRLEGDFLKPLRTGMQVIVEIELLRLGERSITLGYRIRDEDNTVYATASSVHVATDPVGKRAAFPEQFLQALKPHLR